MIDLPDAAYLGQLRKYNDRFACFITLLDSPLGASRRKLGPESTRELAAIRVGIKDCIDVDGVRGTWGSGVHRDRTPQVDANVVARLREAGAVLVATTNLHEFAFGGTTQNVHYGNCRNAWDRRRVPGGSSGGSAVAVALGLCDMALGTDTGASVRLPASVNGVIGFRPTHGAFSSRGVMPVSPPNDTVGVLARDVSVVRRTFRALREFDRCDPHSRPGNAARAEKIGPNGLRVGIATSLLEDCDPSIIQAFERGLLSCRAQGLELMDVASRSFVDVASELGAIVIADAASFHRERLENQPDEIGAAVHARIARGLTMAAVEYAGHLRWLERYRLELARTFEEVDFLVAPTVPVSPPLIADADDAVTTTSLLSRNCWLAPAAGLPAITIPCGLDDNAVPIGFQVVGPRWSDMQLIGLAEAIQRGLADIGAPPEYLQAHT